MHLDEVVIDALYIAISWVLPPDFFMNFCYFLYHSRVHSINVIIETIVFINFTFSSGC